jgi:two-component system cell cycle sensor histidine kinase/response regulator CckA
MAHGLDADAELSDMLQAWTRAGYFHQNYVTGEHLWSQGLRRCLGLPDDFVVTPESFIGLAHPDDVVHMIETASRAAADPSCDRYELEVRMRHAEGHYIRMRARSSYERDAEGRVVVERGVMRDIDELVDLEQRLIVAQRRSAIGRLAAGVAHDFNNMLSAVLGEASLQLLQPELAEEQAQAFRAIVDATERAATLSHRLLTFSRQHVVSTRVLELGECLQGLERILRRVIAERCALLLERNHAPLLVHADPIQIEQVVMNLVVNARDAIAGTGTITIRCSAREGEPRLAELIVTDDGIGMSPELLARAQEEFFTTKAHGTGLGLATCRQIVGELGGRLELDSTPGAGTRVHVLIPLVPDYAVTQVADELKLRASTGTSVLVVEDEPLLVDLALRGLRGFGFTAHGETDRGAALRWLVERGSPVDVLVSDGIMPGLELPEFLHEFRRLCPEAAIVLCSGYLPEGGGELPEGITHLAKPFTPYGLARTAQAALGEWRARGVALRATQS